MGWSVSVVEHVDGHDLPVAADAACFDLDRPAVEQPPRRAPLVGCEPVRTMIGLSPSTSGKTLSTAPRRARMKPATQNRSAFVG